MWKWTRKDENRPAPIPSAVPLARSIPSEESLQAVPGLQSVESFCHEATHIGKSIVVKGEVSGSENVYLAGELEGIYTPHVAIEEGASLKGRVLVQKNIPALQRKKADDSRIA